MTEWGSACRRLLALASLGVLAVTARYVRDDIVLLLCFWLDIFFMLCLIVCMETVSQAHALVVLPGLTRWVQALP